MTTTKDPVGLALDRSSLGVLCGVPGEGADFLSMLGVNPVVREALCGGDLQVSDRTAGNQGDDEIQRVVEGLREAIGTAIGRLDLHTGQGAPAVAFLAGSVAVVADIGAEVVTWARLNEAALADQFSRLIAGLAGDELVMRVWSRGALVAEIRLKDPEVSVRASSATLRDRLARSVDPAELLALLWAEVRG